MEETTGTGPTTKGGLPAVLLVLGLAAAFIAVTATAMVLGAYGCGKLLALWLPFSPFEATAVSLLALMSSLWAAIRLLARFLVFQRRFFPDAQCSVCGERHEVHGTRPVGDDEDGDDEDEVKDDEDVEEDDDEESWTPNHGLRAALYSSGTMRPNAPCPCGGDRRYNKCCGDGRLFRRSARR